MRHGSTGESNFQIRSDSFRTQDERIEALLRSRYGQWFPCYELANLALQYCRAVNSIRKRLARAGDFERVENQRVSLNGQIHGSYRIARTADSLLDRKPAPKPEEVPWEQRPRTTGLELWDAKR